MISLFPFLTHTVLSKPAELLDLNFDMASAANETKLEARTDEAEGGGKQTAGSLTLTDLFGSFSTSSLNDALSTNGLSNLVSREQTLNACASKYRSRVKDL